MFFSKLFIPQRALLQKSAWLIREGGSNFVNLHKWIYILTDLSCRTVLTVLDLCHLINNLRHFS